MSVVKRRATGDDSGEEFDVFVVLNDLVVELVNVRNIHTAILKENTYKIKSIRKEKKINIKIECIAVNWGMWGGIESRNGYAL